MVGWNVTTKPIAKAYFPGFRAMISVATLAFSNIDGGHRHETILETLGRDMWAGICLLLSRCSSSFHFEFLEKKKS